VIVTRRRMRRRRTRQSLQRVPRWGERGNLSPNTVWYREWQSVSVRC